MDWIKQHADSIVVLGAIISSVLWMNGRFNEIDSRFNTMEKEVAIIKTVMVMQKIMPAELCSSEHTEQKK